MNNLLIEDMLAKSIQIVENLGSFDNIEGCMYFYDNVLSIKSFLYSNLEFTISYMGIIMLDIWKGKIIINRNMNYMSYNYVTAKFTILSHNNLISITKYFNK